MKLTHRKPVHVFQQLVIVCFCLKFQLDGATYHTSKFKTAGGGVGRNIAEGLSKLHGHVEFVSKIGEDKVKISFQDFNF